MKPAHPISAAVWAGGRPLADSRVSPDGQTVAFITASSQRAELALFPLDAGCEIWLPLEPAIKRASGSGGGVYEWLPDGTGIVYAGADGKLYRFDLDTHTSMSITRTEEALSTLSVSPDGSQVAYVIDTQFVALTSTIDENAWPRRISSDADFVFDAVWSPDGQYVAWHEWDVPNMPWDGSRIVVRTADASGPVITVAGGDNVSVQQPRFSPDGRRLAYLSDESGWLNLWSVDVPSFDKARPVLSESFEHGEPSWGSGQRSYCWTNDNELLLTRNEGGRGRLLSVAIDGAVFDLQRGYVVGLDSRQGTSTGVVSDIDRGTELFVTTREAQRVIARGPLAGLERAAIEPEAVSWTSEDGEEVHGRLYRKSSSPTPMLVWITGGPTAQSRATLFARVLYFVERGWSVLVVDYRGTTGWGRAYQQALRGEWGRRDVADVASGIRHAIAQGWADPKVVVPFGGSAGGFTVLLTLALHDELCSAGVALYPVTDIVGLGEDTWRFEAHYNTTLVGALPAAYDEYVARSPVTHASNIRKPLLLMHGDKDEVVPLKQSQAVADVVSRNRGIVEFHTYEGEGHGWKKSATKIDELERVNTFLRRHVLHLGVDTGGTQTETGESL